jgi:N-6 DNA Methylase
MPTYLPLTEIRARAVAFSKGWKGETSESAEKQTFWNEFFNVFGIHRRRVATFEEPVQLLGDRRGRIDLFWPGVLLVEHKSAGADLTAAARQAANYFDGIGEEDIPKYVMVSDFAKFRLYNLEREVEPIEFPLEKLHLHVSDFAFLTGHTFRPYEDAPKVNVKAAENMADLHDALRRNRYAGEPLAVFLVRLMFCLFADCTGLFPRSQFRDVIERKTRSDGSDVGGRIALIFRILNQREDERQQNLDADIAALPYVNGHLFEARYDPPEFDADARKKLLKCCSYDWSEVSPAIFGAMFQMVMDEDDGRRRAIGAHYTSEKNILKALGPLLLDGLKSDIEKATTAPALRAFLQRVADIAVLDPACGCGNFLVIAHRELRRLELAAYRKLAKLDKKPLSIVLVRRIEVDAMYGIEIDPFACRVAETALYLVDHQMNLEASEEFGENYIRLPLDKAPHITAGNALRMDWSTVVPAERLSCIVGNPPFVGKAFRTAQQSADMDVAFGQWHKHGELDYVAAWYAKALAYIR